MAKAPAAEPAGMERPELRKHLKFARKQPIHVAFALGGDGKAIILMDKRKQPRAIEKGLKESAPDSKQHRFGTVEVSEADPKLARFHINKPAGGFARKLIVALKGTGFNKIEIVTSEGTDSIEVEDEDVPDDDDDEEDTGPSQVRGPEVLEDDEPAPPRARRGKHDDGPDAPEPAPQGAKGGPSPEPPTGKARAAKLTEDLHKLVKDMMEAIVRRPSQRKGLTQIAIDARAALKSGDLDQAEAAIGILDDALDAIPSGPDEKGAQPEDEDDGRDGDEDAEDGPPPGPHAGLSEWQRRNLTEVDRQFTDALGDAQDQLDQLWDAVNAANDDFSFDPSVTDDLGDLLDKVRDGITSGLNGELIDLSRSRSLGETEKLRKQAKAGCERIVRFLGGNKLVKAVEANPFVTVSLVKTLSPALHGINKALR